MCEAVVRRFVERGIGCAVVGEVTASPEVRLRRGGETALLWDVAAQTFITARSQSQSQSQPKPEPRHA
jgi:selenophosphate synthetase-related protein